MPDRKRLADLSPDERAMAANLGGGKARRAANLEQRSAWSPGSLPLAWQTRVDPAKVLLHVTKPGRPVPKGRPQVNKTTGNVFTPTSTVDAEDEWRWIMRVARKLDGPSGRLAGVLAWFRMPDDRGGDGDNLIKLAMDAACGGGAKPGIILLDDKQVVEWHVHVLRSCSDPGTDLLIYER
jgi:Holliday junction resolvase RusA-like endonuclease